MISLTSQLVEEVRSGNFTNIAKLFEQNRVFNDYCAEIISAIITGCSVNHDSKVLYLVFLEVSKVIDTPAEDISLGELKSVRETLVSEKNSSLQIIRSKDFYEKWFKFQIQEKRYSVLIRQIFDVANYICEQSNDLYATEIIDYMCTNKDPEYRKYALLNMDNIERFLDDKNEEIAKMAREITDVKNTYSALPLDGHLLVDLLESALKTGIIKCYPDFDSKSYKVHSDLFTESRALSIPEYCFKLSNLKIAAYMIYDAIANKELEFVEGKTPIFYTNLLSNNPRML